MAVVAEADASAPGSASAVTNGRRSTDGASSASHSVCDGPAGTILKAHDDHGSLVLLRSREGSRWEWSDLLSKDPLCELFDSAAIQARAGRATLHRAKPAACLSWSATRGRYARTARMVQRGELLLEVEAIALVVGSGPGCSDARATLPIPDQGAPFLDPAAILSQSCRKTAKQKRIDAAALGLDASHVALVLSLLQSRETRTGLGRARLRSLLSHVNVVSADERDTWLRCARRMRACLLGAAPALSDGLCGSDEELARLLMAVRHNVHRVLDDASQSRTVGVGLYPAAAMLNHSCFPTAAVSFADGGRRLQLRAIVNLAPGDEVNYSYLEEAQLCSPWAERRALLAEAHHFVPVEHPQRAATEAAALCHCRVDSVGLERLQASASSVVARVQAAAAQLSAASQPPAQSLVSTLRHETDSLRLFIERELEPALHPAHWLVQDGLAALMWAARALGDQGLLARSAMRLIRAREEVLPLGTPQLANLYNAFGAALARLLREGVVPADKQAEAAREAEAALEAACKIRICCFGHEHPLCIATGKAHAAALEQRRRRTS